MQTATDSRAVAGLLFIRQGTRGGIRELSGSGDQWLAEKERLGPGG